MSRRLFALGCRDPWDVARWLRTRPDEMRILRAIRAGVWIREEYSRDLIGVLADLGLVYTEKRSTVSRLSILGSIVIDLLDATEVTKR